MSQTKKIKKKRPKVSVETQTDFDCSEKSLQIVPYIEKQTISTQTDWISTGTQNRLKNMVTLNRGEVTAPQKSFNPITKETNQSTDEKKQSKKPSKRFNQISSLSTIEETKSTLSKTLTSCGTSSLLSNKTVTKPKKGPLNRQINGKLPTIESDDGKKSKIPVPVKLDSIQEKKISPPKRLLLSKSMIERSKRITEALKSDLKTLTSEDSSPEKDFFSSNKSLTSLRSIKRESLKSLPIKASPTLSSQKSLLNKTSSLEISPRSTNSLDSQRIQPRSISESFLARRERVAQKLGIDRSKALSKRPALESIKQEKTSLSSRCNSSMDQVSVKRNQNQKPSKQKLKSALKKNKSLDKISVKSDITSSIPNRPLIKSRELQLELKKQASNSRDLDLKMDLKSSRKESKPLHIKFNIKPQESHRTPYVTQNLGLMSTIKRPQSNFSTNDSRRKVPSTLLNVSYKTRENIKKDLIRARKDIKNRPFANVFIPTSLNSRSDSSSSGIQSLSPSSFDTSRSCGSTEEHYDYKKKQKSQHIKNTQSALKHNHHKMNTNQTPIRHNNKQLVIASSNVRNPIASQQNPPQSVNMKYGFFMYKKVTRQPGIRMY